VLDIDHAMQLITGEGNALSATAILPEDGGEFFARRGPAPCSPIARRSFHRFYFRHPAVMLQDGERYGVFTLDVSRHGVGFVSPVQIFPKQVVELRLPDGRCLRLEAARCRRIKAHCYECGSRFVVGGEIRPESGA
jgi:hypothetical protein